MSGALPPVSGREPFRLPGVESLPSLRPAPLLWTDAPPLAFVRATPPRGLGPLAFQVARARAPEYRALVRDGLLEIVIGVGYDDHHRGDRAILDGVLRGLAARGFVRTGDGTFAGTWWVARERCRASIRLITPEVEGAARRFAEEMARAGLILYAGHCRMGAGPDFGPIDDPASLLVFHREPSLEVGAPLAAMKETIRTSARAAEHHLDNIEPLDRHRLMLFEGCDTHLWLDALRDRFDGAEVVVSRGVVQNDARLVASVLYMLDAVRQGSTAEQIERRLSSLNDGTRFELVR